MADEQHPDLARGQSTAEPVPGWPKGVRPISAEGTGMLGVSPEGLYWNGQPLRTESRLDLTNAQRAKLRDYYFAFGDADAIVTYEAPDAASAASIAMTLGASGATPSAETLNGYKPPSAKAASK